MSKDIVERLRDCCNPTADDAADEIERLRAQRDDTVESVTKALHEIHNYTPYDAKQFLHPLMERLGHPMVDPELDEGGG